MKIAVSFVSCRKLRKRDDTKFRIQLCLSMILMLVFFVTGIYQVETFEICVVASALLHYFTLVTAMWLAADALLMILKLNLVFPHPSTRFIVIISLICWRKFDDVHMQETVVTDLSPSPCSTSCSCCGGAHWNRQKLCNQR